MYNFLTLRSLERKTVFHETKICLFFLEFTDGKKLNYCFIAGTFSVIEDYGNNLKIACSYFLTGTYFHFRNRENSANTEHQHASNIIMHLFLLRIIYILKLKTRRHPDCAGCWHLAFTRLSVILPCINVR
jgi:hypothetical protein